MDWLSIIIAILVFVLPAVFESDRKKKRKKVRETPEIGTVTVVPEVSAVPAAHEVPEPPKPEPRKEVRAVAHTDSPAAPRSRRRIKGRDLIIYHELMKPKWNSAPDEFTHKF